jgi:restriction system protein
MESSAVWGIHAGKTGDADTLFIKKSCVALGWHEVGDLSHLPDDREAFKSRLLTAYPGKKTLSIAVSAGQLFRFIFEAKAGQIVAYPSRADRQIYLGQFVEGGYFYSSDSYPGYPHRRAVKWLKTVPRTNFSQGALYEIGAAMSFFQIKTYADEFSAALEQTPEIPPVAEDETVNLVAEEIEETTRDFILKQLAQELKGHPFAEFVAHLLGTIGYQTRISPEGPDGGIDIIAHRDELGFEPPIIKVQVKSSEGSIGDPIVSALYGKVGPGEFGLLVTLGTFSSQAISFGRSKSNLRLVDAEELVRLILRHYDKFNSRYKALLPLKRVYIPEPLSEENE